ncbi:DUF4232 domain-containing protein [Curtobacterium pusillum]|uniref:DUF4232 domain-containing protein n=1 Tax=Curtobacterium pusillum TaxID=69373 RepID=A0ABX2MIC2_9MICO|nr:DUF4232 domain-containing protein [Curtobacterium pusillum]NUU15606.1 DUF4232 domain-containing protein [Curtobacterium pusillum]GLK32673.1 hypothetical protein GCM10017610_29580 [Curtobacterium pusillum]
MQRRVRTPVLIATGLAAVGLLAGCSSDGTPTPTATATATKTVTAAPSPEPSSTASTSAASSPAPSGGAAGGSGGVAACATSSLAGSIEAGSGGAAGSTYVHLVLRNTGATTCTLQGWPGVSFVGDTNGTQLGNAASEDRASAHPTVTLAAGQEAVAPLKITNSENYPSGKCDPVSPDGFRVYPPGSKQSLFVAATDYTACRSTDVTVLNVQALVPEGQAAD